MLMVLAQQAIEDEPLLDGLFDPPDEFGVAAPFGDPSGKVLAGLLDRTAVIEPAQFLRTAAVDLARQVIRSVAQECV
jgi:hypothetical protein